MTVASTIGPPTAFEIKSANLPLVALLLKSADMQVMAQELDARFGNDPGFFADDALIIDLTPLNAAARRSGNKPEMVDYAVLLPLLRRYRLAPIAVRGGNQAQTEAALAAGLANGLDARVVAASPPTPAGVHPTPAHVSASIPRSIFAVQPAAAGVSTAPAAAPAPSVSVAPAEAAAPASQAPQPAPARAPEPAPVAIAAPIPAPSTAASPAAPLGAMVISKPLRSGQQVYARGRDLVVLAMVNPGAEVIADGHIHVYAPLRGKAMAGARGNTEARIFALSLEAELISIAGIYRTSDNPLPAHVLGKPTQISLEAGPEGEKLILQALL